MMLMSGTLVIATAPWLGTLIDGGVSLTLGLTDAISNVGAGCCAVSMVLISTAARMMVTTRFIVSSQ